MNKQRHCGETIRNNTDLDFDLGCDTLLALLHNGRAQNNNLYEDENGSNAPPEKRIKDCLSRIMLGVLVMCGAKSTAFWLR